MSKDVKQHKEVDITKTVFVCTFCQTIITTSYIDKKNFLSLENNGKMYYFTADCFVKFYNKMFGKKYKKIIEQQIPSDIKKHLIELGRDLNSNKEFSLLRDLNYFCENYFDFFLSLEFIKQNGIDYDFNQAANNSIDFSVDLEERVKEIFSDKSRNGTALPAAQKIEQISNQYLGFSIFGDLAIEDLKEKSFNITRTKSFSDIKEVKDYLIQKKCKTEKIGLKRRVQGVYNKYFPFGKTIF